VKTELAVCGFLWAVVRCYHIYVYLLQLPQYAASDILGSCDHNLSVLRDVIGHVTVGLALGGFLQVVG